MNNQYHTEDKYKFLIISGVSLLLGFILISSTVVTTLGKPNFDGSNQGKYCADLWKKIRDLYDKKNAQNGGLSPGDVTDLAKYEKSYTVECAPTYGYLVVNPINQQDSVLYDNTLDNPTNQPPKNPNTHSQILNNDLSAKLQ